MAVTDFYPPDGMHDWTDSTQFGDLYNGTTVITSYSNLTTPSVIQTAYWVLDTGPALSGQTVTAADFHFYVASSSASKFVTKEFVLQVQISGTSYYNVGTVLVTVNGWYALAFPAGALPYLNTDAESRLRFIASDPGAGKSRSMSVYAFDNGANVAYLSVTHEAPVTAVTKAQIIN